MEYQIGDFSIVTRFSVKTLRYYQEEGILLPSRTDAVTGYRYYDDSAVDKAHTVRELRDFGFSIKEIREILSLCREDEDIVPFLVRRSDEIAGQIERFRAMNGRIREFLDQQQEMKGMKVETDSNIIIKELPETLIASIRYRGQYGDVGLHIGALMKEAGRHISGGPFSLYYDREYREDDADIELCFPVRKAVSGNGISSRILPGGRAVTAVHRGSYAAIGDAYRRIMDFMAGMKSGSLLPFREHYLKGPGMIFSGNPKKYVTEIRILIGEE